MMKGGTELFIDFVVVEPIEVELRHGFCSKIDKSLEEHGAWGEVEGG